MYSNKIAKDRPRHWECSYIIRPLALDAFRMPQDVVSPQIFCPLARGPRHAGQAFTLGLMSRLSLQAGHLTLASLILFSLGIAVNPSGDLIGHLAKRVVPSLGEPPGAGEARPALGSGTRGERNHKVYPR